MAMEALKKESNGQPQALPPDHKPVLPVARVVGPVPSAAPQAVEQRSTPLMASSGQAGPGGSGRDQDSDTSSSDDEKSREVPQMGHPAGQLPGGVPPGSYARKRGANKDEEKERKRLKRLLRNRVSAQQARERKKAYLFDLEAKARALEAKNAELEERVQTLQRENFMLRQVVKNTTGKAAGKTAAS